MNALDLALLVLRVWAGVVMLAHGLNHARSIDGTASWFGKVGFSAPRANARLSAIGELAVGSALILGLLTALAAAGLAAIMLVAFWSIHRFVGFFVFHRPDEGYEYVVTLAVVGFVLALVGAGSVSVDAAFGLAGVLDGWVGVLIYIGGLLAAAAQLALLWRKPE